MIYFIAPFNISMVLPALQRMLQQQYVHIIYKHKTLRGSALQNFSDTVSITELCIYFSRHWKVTTG